jgi:hypothetical protein
MKFFISALFCLLLFLNCTGINLRNSPVKFSPNMNPSSEYAEIGTVISKGGFFYHHDSTILFIGEHNLVNTGRSCARSFFYLLSIGDASIDTARVNGAVTKVGIIEQETSSYFGFFYHEHCTIIRGEK